MLFCCQLYIYINDKAISRNLHLPSKHMVLNYKQFADYFLKAWRNGIGSIFMAALWNRACHNILPCVFYLSVFLFFSSLFSAVGDWMSTILLHSAALVRIQNARLKCAARCSLEIQHAKMTQKSPSGNHRTNLSGCIFATKACIDNRKKIVKYQYLLHIS